MLTFFLDIADSWNMMRNCDVIFLGLDREGGTNKLRHSVPTQGEGNTQDSTAANCNIFIQADKLQTLIGAAKVPEIEPIWTSIFAKVNI